MKTLLLITQSYPYGAYTERAFVEPELGELRKRFGRVIVVPMENGGEPCPLPEGIECSLCVADDVFHRKSAARIALAATTPIGWLADSPGYALSARAVARALGKFIKSQELDPADTLAYSFWFDYAAAGLALLRRRLGVRYLMRGHRYDLLIDRARKIRRHAIAESEGLWTVSDAGTQRMRGLFPECSGNIDTAYLGVEMSEKSAGEVPETDALNIVSCSRVAPVKRVDLAVRSVLALAQARPGLKIRYTHFGGTPSELEPLRKLVENSRLPNLEAIFTGDLPHEQVMERLRSGVYDIYMLTSSSEGLPVALMEAMSCGIVPVATDVGGVGEAVQPDCGILLPTDFSLEEFLFGIFPVVDYAQRRRDMAASARNIISERFDSRRLRAEWADRLFELLHD